MRIISQDGTIDIPYDYFSLTIATGKYEDVEVACIYCHNLSSPKGTKLAEYSSKEKAEKAMEMLREYKETKEIRSIPLTKSLMESFSNVKMENFEIYTDGAGDYLKVDIVKKVEYFQFPQDEDMEV